MKCSFSNFLFNSKTSYYSGKIAKVSGLIFSIGIELSNCHGNEFGTEGLANLLRISFFD